MSKNKSAVEEAITEEVLPKIHPLIYLAKNSLLYVYNTEKSDYVSTEGTLLTEEVKAESQIIAIGTLEPVRVLHRTAILNLGGKPFHIMNFSPAEEGEGFCANLTDGTKLDIQDFNSIAVFKPLHKDFLEKDIYSFSTLYEVNTKTLEMGGAINLSELQGEFTGKDSCVYFTELKDAAKFIKENSLKVSVRDVARELNAELEAAKNTIISNLLKQGVI